MSDRRKDLIERQHRAWNAMQDIQRRSEEEGRDWSAEERASWDKAEAELTQVSEDLDRLERSAKLEAADFRSLEIAGGAPVEVTAEARAEKYAEAFGKWMRSGGAHLSAEQRQLLMEHEVRAEGTATNSAGGYLVPPGYRAVIQETLKQYGGLLNIANVITTSTGNALQWPTNDDTSNVGAILAENTQISQQDLTFGTRTLGAYVYTSKLVLVSLQLLQDSAFDLNTWLPRKLGERIGRAVSAHLCTGDGSSKPTGIATSPTVAVTGATGQTTSVTYDNLVDLEHSVDPAYRLNARYLMSDQALKMVRKLKDSMGRPLWVPVPAVGMSPTINGWEYTIDQGIPAPGASANSILFGDFKAGYIVRQVNDVQMVRMAERYADYLQVGFFGFSRLDAKPDDANAVKAYQHSAT